MSSRRLRSLPLALGRCTAGGQFGEWILLVGLVALAGVAAFKVFGGSVSHMAEVEGQHVATLEGMKGGGAPPASLPPAPDIPGPGSACVNGACSGGPGNSCFVAGTPVATPDGERPIEQIVAGDFVLSGDEQSGEVVVRRALKTFVTPDAPLVEVHLVDRSEAIRATPGHLFFTRDRGWIEAAQLAPGEPLSSPEGDVRVADVRPLLARATVYNFEVEETHTYFVSGARALVHNPTDCNGKRPNRFKRFFQKLTGSSKPPPPPTGGWTALDPNGNGTVLSGHGSYDPDNGLTQVPEGTWVHMPSWHNTLVALDHGYAIEHGDQAITPVWQFPGSDGAHVYPPGSMMPNYTLSSNQSGGDGAFVPGEHPHYGPAVTVNGPTPIEHLLQPNMGDVHWSACMVDRQCYHTPYYGVPSYPPEGAQPASYPPLPNHTHPRWPNGAPAVPTGHFGMEPPPGLVGGPPQAAGPPPTSFDQILGAHQMGHAR